MGSQLWNTVGKSAPLLYVTSNKSLPAPRAPLTNSSPQLCATSEKYSSVRKALPIILTRPKQNNGVPPPHAIIARTRDSSSLSPKTPFTTEHHIVGRMTNRKQIFVTDKFKTIIPQQPSKPMLWRYTSSGIAKEETNSSKKDQSPELVPVMSHTSAPFVSRCFVPCNFTSTTSTQQALLSALTQTPQSDISIVKVLPPCAPRVWNGTWNYDTSAIYTLARPIHKLLKSKDMSSVKNLAPQHVDISYNPKQPHTTSRFLSGVLLRPNTDVPRDTFAHFGCKLLQPFADMENSASLAGISPLLHQRYANYLQFGSNKNTESSSSKNQTAVNGSKPAQSQSTKYISPESDNAVLANKYRLLLNKKQEQCFLNPSSEDLSSYHRSPLTNVDPGIDPLYISLMSDNVYKSILDEEPEFSPGDLRSSHCSTSSHTDSENVKSRTMSVLPKAAEKTRRIHSIVNLSRPRLSYATIKELVVPLYKFDKLGRLIDAFSEEFHTETTKEVTHQPHNR